MRETKMVVLPGDGDGLYAQRLLLQVNVPSSRL